MLNTSQTLPLVRLAIHELKLSYFRNYTSLHLKIPEGPVVLTGHNGAGKTNILEAISLLVPGRGLRGSRLDTITSFTPHPGESYAWAVSATMTTHEGTKQIGTAYSADKSTSDTTAKRILAVDQETIRSQSRLGELVSMIWLTPQMDQILLSGSAPRRKFLDRCVSNFYKEHASHLARYDYALRERARLLQLPRMDGDWLNVLETRLAEYGVAIALARLETITTLQDTINRLDTIFPKATITVTDELNPYMNAHPALAVEQFYKERLLANRSLDAKTGRTHFGVHRSDLVLIHNEKQIPIDQCSTGEQKALLLTLILATARAEYVWRHTVPIILLDEVVAHLDAERREVLLNDLMAMNAQLWLTGTDPSFFANIRPYSTFLSIREGQVVV